MTDDELIIEDLRKEIEGFKEEARERDQEITCLKEGNLDLLSDIGNMFLCKKCRGSNTQILNRRGFF